MLYQWHAPLTSTDMAGLTMIYIAVVLAYALEHLLCQTYKDVWQD